MRTQIPAGSGWTRCPVPDLQVHMRTQAFLATPPQQAWPPVLAPPPAHLLAPPPAPTESKRSCAGAECDSANAARWRRHIGLSGRDSAHNLHGPTDSSNYPSIFIHDPSSPSSSSGDEGRPFRNRGKEKQSGHSSSPMHLSDRQTQSRCRHRFTSSFSGGDAPVERAKSRAGFLAESGEEPERGRTSGEELSAVDEINVTLSSRNHSGWG